MNLFTRILLNIIRKTPDITWCIVYYFLKIKTRSLLLGMSQRHRVINLYKELYHIGKEYPKGALWFHERLKNAFLKNKNEMDPEKVEELIKRGEYVINEIKALYMLRKYRAMKERYYEGK